MDIFQPAGYLRFLTWFALECIPAWNLPPSLLPDDLLPVLNHPVRPPLPLTAAMRVFGDLRGLAGIGDLDTAPDEAVVATSFELLPDLLEAGDPRLIPDLVSKFWSKPLSRGPGVVECIRIFRGARLPSRYRAQWRSGRRPALVRHPIQGVAPAGGRVFLRAGRRSQRLPLQPT